MGPMYNFAHIYQHNFLFYNFDKNQIILSNFCDNIGEFLAIDVFFIRKKIRKKRT